MKNFRKILKWLIYIFITTTLIICCIILFVHFYIKPSNNRDWNPDQEILQHAKITEEEVTIYNIRNFVYASTTSYTKNYYDKTFKLDDIKKVWYVVEPFSGIPGSAHTFLSFEFKNNNFVSISIEIRKQKGEAYHPIKGLFNQYELMYVIADERDVIKLRSNYRKDLVYLYPINATPDKTRELFVSMLERANDLKENPEFYNTLANTCTTNIVKHVNSITPKKIPFLNKSVFFPESSDRLAYDLGLIDTDLTFEEARKKYFINDRALKYADSPDFSIKIRASD